MSVLAVLASVKLMKPAPATSAFTTSGEGGIRPAAKPPDGARVSLQWFGQLQQARLGRSHQVCLLGRSRNDRRSIALALRCPAPGATARQVRDFDQRHGTRANAKPAIYQIGPVLSPAPVTPQRNTFRNQYQAHRKGTACRDPASPQECQRGITEHARSTRTRGATDRQRVTSFVLGASWLPLRQPCSRRPPAPALGRCRRIVLRPDGRSSAVRTRRRYRRGGRSRTVPARQFAARPQETVIAAHRPGPSPDPRASLRLGDHRS